MASTLPSPMYMNSQAHTTLRIPKLSYRNAQSDAESVSTVSTDASRTSASTNLTSPTQSTFCPSPREPPGDMTNLTSPRSSSFASSTLASRPLKDPPKKRPNFFSGLFSAKEPSTQAFADYQKTLLKQGHGRTNTVGLPGVSSAKLPPTVPKVNSKWDGVPETLKEKEKQKQESRQSTIRHDRPSSSTRSTGSGGTSTSTSTSQRRLSRGTLGGVSTQSSAISTNRLADLYGWETRPNTISSSSSAVVDFASEHRPTTSRLQTSHSAPAPSKQPPPLDRTYLFPPHASSDRHISPQWAQSSTSISGSPKVPSLLDSPALTPCEPLPITPDASPMINLESEESETEMSQLDNIKTTILEAPASVDEVVIKSAGLNILGPPATAKRRAKISHCQSGDDRPKTAGLDMPLNSILKKEARPGPESYFPDSSSASPASNVRLNSSRERVGLGMSMKNHIIAPWSSPGLACEPTAEIQRVTTPTPEGGQYMKKKGRMSMFKK